MKIDGNDILGRKIPFRHFENSFNLADWNSIALTYEPDGLSPLVGEYKDEIAGIPFDVGTLYRSIVLATPNEATPIFIKVNPNWIVDILNYPQLNVYNINRLHTTTTEDQSVTGIVTFLNTPIFDAGFYINGELFTSLADSFIELLDTPDTYTDNANKYIKVSGTEPKIEFIKREDVLREFVYDFDSTLGTETSITVPDQGVNGIDNVKVWLNGIKLKEHINFDFTVDYSNGIINLNFTLEIGDNIYISYTEAI